MKHLNLISKLTTAFLVVLFISSCEKEVIKEVEAVTYSISGTVQYPDYSGTAIAADGAVVYLKIGATAATTAYDVATVADANGNYSFSGLSAGSNFIYSNFDTENQNNPGGRVTGAIFVGEGALVVVEEADVSQNFTLASVGQADAFAVNNYVGGDWAADWSHSNIDFSFPYDNDNATYTGSFELTETYVDFDPFSLSTSKIEATIDVLTIHTDSPGGRDPLYNSDGTLWQDAVTMAYNLGCVHGYLGMENDNPASANRYSTFKSTKIEAYGDGYLATGDFTLNGVTAPVSMFFKFFPGFEGTNRSGAPTLYSSFEGTFDFAAFQVFGVDSGHIGQTNDVTIDVSFQVTKAL
ncbi:MAG: YceI family protein [Cyclobacteriaceae bacterium]|nr:YceI family protein [Cyclobacteriaceae bacterium]